MAMRIMRLTATFAISSASTRAPSAAPQRRTVIRRERRTCRQRCGEREGRTIPWKHLEQVRHDDSSPDTQRMFQPAEPLTLA
jgi:hypothetical protein